MLLDSTGTASARRLGTPFWTLCSATALTNIADGVVRVLIPLLAVHFTDNVTLVALATTATTLPWMLVALPVGVLADRVDRRLIVVTADGGRAVILVIIAVAAATGVLNLPLLYVAAFGLGACEVTTDLTTRTLLPMVVRRDQLPPANAWLLGTQTTLDEFVGPPVGGALIALGAWLAAGGTAASYAVAGVVLLLLPGGYRAPRTTRAPVRADLVAGLKFVWQHRLRRTISLMIAVMAGCWSAWTALLVLYATRDMGLSTSGYGVLVSMLAVGGVAGSACAVAVERRWGRRAVMAVDVVTTTLMLGTPALTSNPVLVGASIVVGGWGSAMWNVTVLSLVALITPEFIRGRAGAAARMISWGTMPLGAAAGGVVASITSLPAVFAGIAAITALMLIPVIRVTTPAAIDDAIATAERLEQETS